MTTKEEFVEMWNNINYLDNLNSLEEWRSIVLLNDDNISANNYVLFDDYVVLKIKDNTIAKIHYNTIKRID